MRWVALSLLLPLTAAAGPMYGGSPQSRPVVGAMSNAFVAKSVKTRADKHGFRIRAGGPDGSWSHPREKDGMPLKKLSRTELLALYTVLGLDLKDDDRTLEWDLRIEGPSGEQTATVWMEGDWLAVQAGGPMPAAPTATREAFAKAWPGFVLTEVDATWTPELLGALDEALKSMPDRDVRSLEGTPIVRRRARPPAKSGSNVWTPPADMKRNVISRLAAQFVLSEEGPRIEVYDGAIRDDPTTFVGTLDAPHTKLAHTLIHEFGHAISRLDAGFSPDLSEPARGYEAARDGRDGPTQYGMSSPEEGFAEAYALWCLDKPALERAQPAVRAWFDTRGGARTPVEPAQTASSTE